MNDDEKKASNMTPVIYFYFFTPALDTFMKTNFDTRKLQPVYNVNSLILCEVERYINLYKM